MNKKEIGNKGEHAAALYLERQGYRIIERQYHSGYGEIDLIAADNDTIVFVEVKTRKTSAWGEPVDFVDRHKQKCLTKTALVYMTDKDYPARFDVIGIIYEIVNGEFLIKNIEWIKNAFYPAEI